MRNGLKLFENFEGLFLEVRVGPEAKSKFRRIYGGITGENATNDNAFMVRTRNGWPNGIDVKAYFEAPMWVIDSLRKLGYRVVKRQIDMDKYEGGLREYTWKICSLELFWWLVGYGYRVGKNTPIAFETYLMKKHLEEMETPPLFNINNHETENPIFEAQLFSSVA